MTLFLILKSIFRIRKKNFSLIIAIIGISIGVFSVISISGIMNGMQSLLIDKLILVETYDYRGTISINSSDELKEITQLLLGIDGVEYATAFIDHFSLLENKQQSEVINIRAIDFDMFLKDTQLFKTMRFIYNKYPYYAYEELNSAIIGRGVAQKLQIIRNDTVKVTFPGEEAGFLPIQLKLLISDKFSVAQKYNENWLFLPLQYYLSQYNKFPYTINFGIRAKRNNTLKNNLETVLNNISTWEKNNGSFYIALKTEKIMLFLMLIAIFGVIILHFRFLMIRRINRKREEIVALRTIGSISKNIQLWFIGETIIIGILGCILGTVFGTLFLYYFSNISEWLATTFNLFISIDTDTIISSSILDIIYTGVFTLILLSLTSISIVKSINKISPIQIIHYE